MFLGNGQKCNSSLREVLHFRYFLSSHLSIRFNLFLHNPNLSLRPRLLGQHWTTEQRRLLPSPGGERSDQLTGLVWAQRVGPLKLTDSFFNSLPWPCGVAEQCSRHRKKGAQCLSATSLHAAGVGQLRREHEGPRYGQHGFGYFCLHNNGCALQDTPSNKLGARRLNTVLLT